MAKYDYWCPACDLFTEVERPIVEDEPDSGHLCPSCGYRMVKQMTIPAIQFKGSGFYSTENKHG